MSFYAPEGFDEDRASRFDFDDDAPALRLADAPTRCIEHGQLSCAECDGEWAGMKLIQPEVERMAA